MFDNEPQNRRAFLRHTGQLALSSTTLPFMLNLAAIGEAAAFNATGDDYKALVCIFLSGGSDYANTLVPYDDTRYNDYAGIRGELAVPIDKLDATLLKPTVAPKYLEASLQPGFDLKYALHPGMTGMAKLFNDGKMAIQLNVGPLVEPITRVQFDDSKRTQKLPPQLFSHPDQQQQWNSPSATVENKGWGGGVGDAATDSGLNSGASSQYTCISVAGNGVYLAGNDAVQYQLDENVGAIAIKADGAPYNTIKGALKTLIEKSTGTHKLELAYNAISARSSTAVASIQAALSDTTTEGIVNAAMLQNPELGNQDDRLRKQLKMVARLIQGRAKLGSPRRQVFYVELREFDLHDNLKDGVNDKKILTGQGARLTALSSALSGFQDALGKLGLTEKVTSFTASDFGRTLVVNGGGSDHGWGNHHFVVGGAVIGKTFYGTPPPISASNEKDTVTKTYKPQNQWHVGEGRLLPTTSVDQYAGTLAKWFGVNDAELATIFPNLKNFGVTKNGITYSKDMGFMVA